MTHSSIYVTRHMPRLFLFDFHPGSRFEMASDSFESVLSSCGVDPSLASQLLSAGWTSATFREIVNAVTDFDDSVITELLPNDSVSLLQKSALKATWRQLHSGSSGFTGNTASSAASHLTGMPDGSWSEAFAPKLSSSVISQLKVKFAGNYPLEVLTPETMPSTRLLSLAHQHHQKQEYKWLPWKFRMSMSKADDMAIQRSGKVPRLENLQLHQLLLDEPPCLDLNHHNRGLHSVRQMFDLHNYAWALTGAAHLHRLRSFSLRFMSLLSPRLDPESGLRAASILEAQQADKHLWHLIHDLCAEQGFSLHDALLEFTQNRRDMAALLQPRPRVPKPSMQPSSKGSDKGSKGASKGASKGSKQGKGKASTKWVSELWQGNQRKILCMRFQSEKCSSQDCRFTHKCAFPRSDGSACGGDHPASQHERAPH